MAVPAYAIVIITLACFACFILGFCLALLLFSTAKITVSSNPALLRTLTLSRNWSKDASCRPTKEGAICKQRQALVWAQYSIWSDEKSYCHHGKPSWAANGESTRKWLIRHIKKVDVTAKNRTLPSTCCNQRKTFDTEAIACQVRVATDEDINKVEDKYSEPVPLYSV